MGVHRVLGPTGGEVSRGRETLGESGVGTSSSDGRSG